MFYIPIQKDFSKVKNKIVFGLTKRQIIFFLLGAAVGIITERFIRPQIRPVANEPILFSCMQVSDYIKEQERLEREAEERSIITRLRKMGGGKELDKHKGPDKEKG